MINLNIFCSSALHNYHNCIYDKSLDKCGKGMFFVFIKFLKLSFRILPSDAAEFALKILELFNRGYLRECAKYANLSHLCSRNRYTNANHSRPSTQINSILLTTAIGFILFVSTFDYCWNFNYR